MAVKIRLKSSATPGKIPLVGDLSLGELAVNSADGKVFVKGTSGTPKVIEVGKDAETAKKLATARTINGEAFDGSANLSIKNIDSLGVIAAQTGRNLPGKAGVSMQSVYSNGYPATYGNVLTLAGQGAGQLLMEWTGAGIGVGRLFYRSLRDAGPDTWSGWEQLYTTAHPPPSSSPFGITELAATAGQTVFSAAYNASRVLVIHNGRVLGPSSYTASNGTTVTIPTVIDGDTVLIISS